MDNRYFKVNCPALMMDGRFITDYTKNSIREQELRKHYKLCTSYDYKMFLQQNATKILNNEYKKYIFNNICDTDCNTPISKLY